MKDEATTTRKTIVLSDAMWADIAAYRASKRIATETEAIRRLIQAQLEREKRMGERYDGRK